MEVVFVSGDHDEASFKDYFGEMPWLAVDFADKEQLRLVDSEVFLLGDHDQAE